MPVLKHFPPRPNFRKVLMPPCCFNCQFAFWEHDQLNCEKSRLQVDATYICDDWQRNPNMETLPEQKPHA